MRRAFTLVELLMVIAIIAILTSLVAGVSVGVLRSARSRRTDAMMTMLQSAINTYYAQNKNGEWPTAIENLADQGKSAVLSESEAQKVFQTVVGLSAGTEGGRPRMLLDPTGLFVTPIGNLGKAGKCYGLNYAEARKNDPAHNRQALRPDRMAFGYPGRKTGKFHPFNIIYSAEADNVIVTKCCTRCARTTEGGNYRCEHPFNDDNPCPVCHLPEGE